MNNGFKDFILDQLSLVEGVRCRKMFDAYGLYSQDRFFGIIHGGSLYFKTNQKTREPYLLAGSISFKPSDTQTLKNYYEVPAEVLEDRTELAKWAALAASLSTRKNFVSNADYPTL